MRAGAGAVRVRVQSVGVCVCVCVRSVPLNNDQAVSKLDLRSVLVFAPADAGNTN